MTEHGLETELPHRAGAGVFSVRCSVYIGSGAHPAPCLSHRRRFPEMKWPDLETERFLYLVPRLKLHGAVPSLLRAFFMAFCLCSATTLLFTDEQMNNTFSAMHEISRIKALLLWYVIILVFEIK
jgi:hypothetical protein